MQDNFGITVGIELMTFFFQSLFYFLVIIYLTIKCNVEGIKSFGLLASFRKIDDAETTMA